VDKSRRLIPAIRGIHPIPCPLIEDGSHDELLHTGGRYASLLRLQTGLHEVG
jgi:hypothetical protein